MNKEKIEGIPIVSKYKYLGIILDNKLEYRDHLEYIENKIQKSVKMINIMNW